ncbi:MAG: AraC family transcriptional regulator [Saccharospirillaceae bacterium]|nr:helix-turn-helix domain-containing protein [Pseudomonadales bacterium]NRB77111.1 AraC family transcriptional regulator [Saccharospirillaceae bacterium]
MINATHYFLSVGSFQGILLAMLLLFSSKTAVSGRILGVWILIMGLGFLVAFLFLDDTYLQYPYLIGIVGFLPASYGAFIYLYFVTSFNGNRFKPLYLLHFTPVVICLVMLISAINTSIDTNIKITDKLHFEAIKASLSLAKLIMYGQAFVYFGLCVLLLIRIQKSAKMHLSNIPDGLFKWLWFVSAIYLIVWLGRTYIHYINENQVIDVMSNLLIISLIIGIAMMQWRNPKLFMLDVLETKQADKDESLRYGENRLPEDLSENLRIEINRHMNEQKPYLDNQLTLPKLAELTGISSHQLSQVINEQEKKNFYQFVNQFRINEICLSLKNKPDSKILDIALASGFSSKSSFNSVFKNFMQQTPSEYRKSLS